MTPSSLDQLKIERSEAPPRRSAWPWILVILLVLVVVAGWFYWKSRFDVVEVWSEADGTRRRRHIEDAFRLWPTG